MDAAVVKLPKQHTQFNGRSVFWYRFLVHLTCLAHNYHNERLPIANSNLDTSSRQRLSAESCDINWRHNQRDFRYGAVT